MKKKNEREMKQLQTQSKIYMLEEKETRWSEFPHAPRLIKLFAGLGA